MKKSIFFTCLLVSMSAFSQIDHSQWESNEFKNYVKSSVADLISETTKKSNDCAKKAMDTDVSAETIAKINALNLNESEATTALGFLAYKAQGECLGELPLKTIGYMQLARKLEVNGYDQASDPNFKNLNTILFDREQEIRFKYLFLNIPKEKREALEKLEELNKPFNISVISKINTTK